MTDLKALSDAATQGVWRTYSLDQRTQILSETYVGETRDYHGDDAAMIVALVNEYRAGRIGDTAAAEKAGYERGLREAAEVVRDQWAHTNVELEAAILAKLEKTDD